MTNPAIAKTADWDPTVLAIDEYRFCRILGHKPLRWILGAKAYSQIEERQHWLRSHYACGENRLGDCIINKSDALTMFGLPAIADPTLSPWTVKLVHSGNDR